jgi:hypothetical protein
MSTAVGPQGAAHQSVKWQSRLNHRIITHTQSRHHTKNPIPPHQTSTFAHNLEQHQIFDFKHSSLLGGRALAHQRAERQSAFIRQKKSFYILTNKRSNY